MSGSDVLICQALLSVGSRDAMCSWWLVLWRAVARGRHLFHEMQDLMLLFVSEVDVTNILKAVTACIGN